MAGEDSVQVLVVDDSPDIGEILTHVLESNGYVVRTARDGVHAMGIIQELQPHCVILDVSMPRMDGLEFARRLRGQYKDDIVLVALSGHALSEPAVSATFNIVDHYLQKPIDFGELDKILPPLAP